MLTRCIVGWLTVCDGACRRRGGEHARSACVLWQAWRLVLERRCVVCALDHLPHHGIRTPHGSDEATRLPRWPATFLGEAEGARTDGRSDAAQAWDVRAVATHQHLPSTVPCAPPSGRRAYPRAPSPPRQVPNWRETLGRQSAEWKKLLDVLIACGRPVQSGDAAASELQQSLAHLAGARRAELTGAISAGSGRLVDGNRIGIIGFGAGGLSALVGLASEHRGFGRVRAAVLGGFSNRFLPLGPGQLPAPPPDEFIEKIGIEAQRVRLPVMWVANEEDEHAPIERARQVYDALGAKDKRLRVLGGAHGAVSVQEMLNLEAWLLAAMERKASTLSE